MPLHCGPWASIFSPLIRAMTLQGALSFTTEKGLVTVEAY